MSNIVNFRTTLAAGICVIIGYLVYINQTRMSDAIGHGLTIVFWWLLFLLTAGGIVVLLMAWNREQTRNNRPVDGSYALIRQRLRRDTVLPDGRIVPKGTEITIIPDNAIGTAIVSHPAYGIVEPEPAAGWAMQADIRRTIQPTHTAQALTVGDQAHISTRGMISTGRGGIPNSATGKLLTGAFDRPRRALPAPAQEAQPVAPPAPRLSLTDALGQSTGSRWIVGQGDDGQIAAFEPESHAHAAIVGATGTGKTTSIGFSVALAALRAGWHVVILDPDGGSNWQPFSAAAEWHNSDRSTFPGQIESIYNLYERRANLTNPRPVLVVVEEYGDLIRQLRSASRSTADATETMIDSILQRGRKRRVHLAMIDQYPEHWSPAIVSGTKFRAVFQLGPNQGAKMEEYKAASLPDVGRFLVRGVEYNSFNASAALPAVLRQLPAPASAKRIINGTATRVPMSSPTSSPTSSVSSSPASSVTLQEVASPSPPTSEPTAPAALATGPTDYQKAAAAYVQAFPTCNQTELMHSLSIAKGYANELWHKYHPKGKNYKLPTGTMDMSNDADRQQFEQLLRAGAITFPEPKEK